MPLVIPAIAGALVVAGLIGLALGIRGTPATPRRASQSRMGPRISAMNRRTKILALAGLIAGATIYILTGWLIAEVDGSVPIALVVKGHILEIAAVDADLYCRQADRVTGVASSPSHSFHWPPSGCPLCCPLHRRLPGSTASRRSRSGRAPWPES